MFHYRFSINVYSNPAGDGLDSYGGKMYINIIRNHTDDGAGRTEEKEDK